MRTKAYGNIFNTNKPQKKGVLTEQFSLSSYLYFKKHFKLKGLSTSLFLITYENNITDILLGWSIFCPYNIISA